ncbi:MAG TPA: alpha/beta hydrolase [Streptomyces sp.]|nr:alpha/beta hydrolase [Streptomyces sp.]
MAAFALDADRCQRLAPDILAVVEEGELAPPCDPGVAGLRAAHDRDAAALAGPGPEMASVTDAVLPGPYGPIPVRVHRPRSDAVLPVVAYFHGGGWAVGSIDSFDSVARRLAAASGAAVVSVGYRLAPEHPFPAPVEDCYAALTWMGARTAELGIDPARIGVAGSSAGGGLAAAVALMARDRGGPQLCVQYLNIPELDDRLDTPSMLAYDDTPIWNRPNALFSWTSYLGAEPGGADVSAYAAPARADDLSGLPRALVVTCQFDPLRDEGLTYAQRLMQAGVNTELHHYPGTFHGSVVMDGTRVSRQMLADEVAALRRAFRMTEREAPGE